MRDQPCHVVRGRDIVREQTRGIRIPGVLEPELGSLLIHALDEPVRPVGRHARQHAGGGIVGRDQQQMQELLGCNLVVGAQIGRRRAEHVATDDGDRLREVGIVLEEHAAVMTLVMLAIDRWLCEFSSQSTSLVSGL